MLTVVQVDLGASRSQMGFVLGAWALIFIATAPLAGRFIDRFGLTRSLLIGGISITLSALARSAATDVTTLWLAVAVFGLGGPLISAGAPTLVRTWFADPTERRRAVSVYAIAPGLGGVLALALTNSVLLPALGSWRAVLLAESAIGAVATTVWLIVAVRLVGLRGSTPPKDAAHSHEGERAAALGAAQGLLASPGVRFALALAFPIFFLNHALNAWMPTVMAELGELSPAVASNWVAASRLVGIGAALIVPTLVPARRRSSVMAALCATIGLALAAMAGGPALAVAALLVIGLRGAMVPIGALLLMEADGVSTNNTGLANGLWFSVGEVGGVSGPFVAGVVADSTFGFTGVVLTLAAIGVVVGALVLVAGPNQRPAVATV